MNCFGELKYILLPAWISIQKNRSVEMLMQTIVIMFVTAQNAESFVCPALQQNIHSLFYIDSRLFCINIRLCGSESRIHTGPTSLTIKQYELYAN